MAWPKGKPKPLATKLRISAAQRRRWRERRAPEPSAAEKLAAALCGEDPGGSHTAEGA
jgi:hypothetical protein